MRKQRKIISERLLCLALTAMLLFGVMSVGTLAAPRTVTGKDGSVSFAGDGLQPFLVRASIEYYGRNALTGLANKDALLYAYDRIVLGVENCAENISIYNGTDPITKDEIKTVFDAYRRDHTEHFWLGNGYSMRCNAETVLSVTPGYTVSGTELEAAKTAFNAAASELLGGITLSMSEYEREKLLHDRLAERVCYDGAGRNAHNSYGALVEGKAVCEGYAEAFQYLLHRAGIQSFIIIGTSTNPVSGMPEGHAWNAVRIDGMYYHVDVTWDDQKTNLFYAYFNKTTAAISEDHSIAGTVYALPECSSENADYFFVNGGRMPEFEFNTVADLLISGGGTARVYVTGDKAAFLHAFAANSSALASGLGYTGGFRYGYANLGREFVLTVAPIGITVSGDVISFGSEADSIRLELFKFGEAAAVRQSDLTGSPNTNGVISVHYSFSDVAEGKYTLRASKNCHVTREYTVTVGTENVTQDVKIHLKGDINGDGSVNISDVNKANLHTKGRITLTGYDFACTDINGDGMVNISDVNRINLHVKGKKLLWQADLS